MNLQTINASASPEVQMNENFEALDWASVFAKNAPTTSALTWGYFGGRWNGAAVVAGTVALTDTSTNYVVVSKATGTVSVSTASTNWDNITNYARLYKLTTAGGVVTAEEDHRAGSFGVFDSPSARNNFSVAAQTPAAATRTYLVGSAISVPAGKLRIGTIFRWTFDMTKTAAGTASSTVDVAVGTAGTTADTARLSFTKPAGTAAADHGRVVIEAVCRGPLSGAGVLSGIMSMTHNLENTGHMVVPCMTQNIISGAFDVTVANLVVGLCLTSGASDAITIQQVAAEALNLG